MWVTSRFARQLISTSLCAGLIATLGCAGKTPDPPPPPPPPPAAPPPPPAPPAPPAPEPPPPPAKSERTLVPAEVDPDAVAYPAPQYAYLDANVKPLGRLVVYLVGARNPPERGRAMGAWLAAQGFHVVVPGYANDYDIRKLCEGINSDGKDEDCHGKLRLEAFEGVDHSPHIAIARPDSLEVRVGRMLEWLSRTEAAGGWSRFAARGLPRWDQIIVAGHSHGSSSSALIAKVRRVERVVMLSGPFDNRSGAPATWLRRRSLTPVDRLWAFSHTKEEQHPGHLKNWKALAVPGALVDVEQTAPPFGKSHQLVTSLEPKGEQSAHGMTTAGKSSPRSDGGEYRFTPVWRYLFGVP